MSETDSGEKKCGLKNLKSVFHVSKTDSLRKHTFNFVFCLLVFIVPQTCVVSGVMDGDVIREEVSVGAPDSIRENFPGMLLGVK